MPFLDLCQLFFDQAATIEDEGSDFSETSIFCEEWCMTLEYVVSQPGLKASYTSRLGAEHDLWVFLGKFVSLGIPFSLISFASMGYRG